MAVKIRLARAGAKKKPYYRVVVANATAPRDGDFLEKVGTYNPLLTKDAGNRISLKADRITYWLNQGAEPTETVAKFILNAGIALPAHVTKKMDIKAKGYDLKAAKRAEEEAVKAKQAALEAKEAAKIEAEAAKAAEAATVAEEVVATAEPGPEEVAAEAEAPAEMAQEEATEAAPENN